MSEFLYTAEDVGGEVRLVHGPATRAVFIELAIERLQDLNDGPGSPQQLDLYEYRVVSGLWLTPFTEGKGFGRVSWVWPGEYKFLAPDESDPRPSDSWMAAHAPASEIDLEGYELNDPKRISLMDALDAASSPSLTEGDYRRAANDMPEKLG